jgi:hypothetical protein
MMRIVGAGVLTLIICGVGSGCARMIPLEPDQLPALATYRGTGAGQVESGDLQVRIDRRHEPKLAVRPHCTAWESSKWQDLCSGEELLAPLDQIEIADDRIVFADETLPKQAMFLDRTRATHPVAGVTRAPEGHTTVQLAHVRDAMLLVRGYRVPGWRPKWGVGASLLGPGVVASINGQYRPFGWLALDAGVVPIAASWWTGARGMFPALGPVRPFAGASILWWVRSPTGDASLFALGSARIGFDVEAGSEQDLVSLEFDVMRRLDGPGPGFVYCESDDRACPFGGITYTHFW